MLHEAEGSPETGATGAHHNSVIGVVNLGWRILLEDRNTQQQPKIFTTGYWREMASVLVLALSWPLTVKEKFFTCWELLPAFFSKPVILGIPAMALKTKQYEE